MKGDIIQGRRSTDEKSGLGIARNFRFPEWGDTLGWRVRALRFRAQDRSASATVYGGEPMRNRQKERWTPVVVAGRIVLVFCILIIVLFFATGQFRHMEEEVFSSANHAIGVDK